nr:hypothetical protein Itr_chr15CG04520 [Ipomoea trifida]
MGAMARNEVDDEAYISCSYNTHRETDQQPINLRKKEGEHNPFPHSKIEKASHYKLSSVSTRYGAALPGCQKANAPYVQNREQPSTVSFLQILPCIHEPYTLRLRSSIESLGEDGCHKQIERERHENSNR